MPSSRPEGSPRVLSLASSLGRAANAFLPRRNRARRHVKTAHDRAAHPALAPSPSALGRHVTATFASCRQLDADGLGIRRASSSIHPTAFSPFLLLDHCGPQRISPHASVGCEAPRCGQQALSYVVSGELHYRDSCGNKSVLSPGNAHLLTAGSGLVVTHTIHSPTIEYFSVWINIPRDAKSAPPVEHMTDNPPSLTIGHGESASRIRVLAGPGRAKAAPDKCHDDASPLRSSFELETTAGRAAVYDVRMQRKSQLVLNPETQRVFVYVYRGSAIIGKRTRVSEGGLAVLEENADLPVVIDSSGVYSGTEQEPDYDFGNFDVFQEHACWCLVLAGDPIMEPVSMLSSGIVACSPQEIRKAFQEYTCGSMGAGTPPKDFSLVSRTALFYDDDSDSDVVENGSGSDNTSSDDGMPDVGFGILEV